VGPALAPADEVRCFSQASRDLLTRAHPAPTPCHDRVSAPDRVRASAAAVSHAGPLVIGVVGN
jgi:hypothetical protein